MDPHLMDTNIVLRVSNRADPEHSLAVNAVATLLANGATLYLTPQVLAEFWSVASRPADVNGWGWDRSVIAAEVDDLLARFPLLEDTPGIFHHWVQLVSSREIRGRQVHDARLVAVMLEHRVTHLLTLNVAHFRRFPEITVVDPRDVR